ncbi:hypothetical protein [Commensalibacter papalotli (ex Servin-Garciduenas et al. 2014)]|uniref:Uncharacterized protein n=1 Tax=Commensalibacter papalotli (ex Servin-Garciduenas et al. 2014) TaxID=1208583 RepID=W7DYZ3_9PROT|nr:hypothetical protein [Commensalibacter papalotli (ex Servin-Garciduenas et al. 2014)]EUK19228.1 hypothetical protein COMX_05740 [Commensalibacter papalotli (ex Servin-Garciduenas et al. 2014)]
MNKLLYTSALCAFSIFLGSKASKAIDFPDHYRTLDIKAALTKSTKDFTAKNVYLFKFPDDLPGTPVLKGVKGQFSTETQANLNADGKEITYSETLFGVDFIKDISKCPNQGKCPSDGGIIYSLDSAYGSGNHFGLASGIVKQTEAGKQVYNFDYTNQYDTVLDTERGGYVTVNFDGTDFQNKPYTMKADLQLQYSLLPIRPALDGEFTIDLDTYTKTRYNANVVYPVVSGPGRGNGVVRPGIITAVGGNASVSVGALTSKERWSVRYVTAVLKHNSCYAGFKKDTVGQRTDQKFQTQGPAGLGAAPNPSPVLWPASTIISDFTLVGSGRNSVVGSASGNKNLPIHVEDGDCIVQAILPVGFPETSPGTYANVESQRNFTYIPD